MTQPDCDGTAAALRELVTWILREAPRAGLSRSSAGTLAALQRLGPLRITSLAEHESVSQPAMTGLLHRLEAAGLVRREDDPLDGRATLVAITPTGIDALEARRRGHDELITSLLCDLPTADRAALAAAAPALLALTENHVHLTH